MKPNAKRALIFIGLCLLTLVFGFVYHLFSHGVTSALMTYAWVPVAGAALFYTLVWLLLPTLSKRPTYRLTVNLLNTATAWQTLGMILSAVIVIAGSSSPYLPFYSLVALVFYGLSLMSLGLLLIKPKA
jgi:uncharacterized membrane protein